MLKYPLIPLGFPDIVTMIGSSRFRDHFSRAAEHMEKKGILVLMMGFFQHADSVGVSEEERAVLDTVDRARIDLCDVVYVINPKQPWCPSCQSFCFRKTWAQGETDMSRCCDAAVQMIPYIGESTRKEIEYAKSVHKPVCYLEPM